MKRTVILLLLFILGVGWGSVKADNKFFFIVKDASGNTVNLEFSERLVGTFSGTNMVIRERGTSNVYTLDMTSSVTSGRFGMADPTGNIPIFFDASFKVYPSPAVDIINVQSAKNLGIVSIIGISGITFRQINAEANTLMIDIGSLPKGIYLITSSAGGQTRIIKQ